MSELQIGDQQSKPQDLQQLDAKVNAAIDSQVKFNMGEMSRFMNMMKGGDSLNVMGEMPGAKDPISSMSEQNQQKSADASLFAGGGRKKGARTLKQMLSTEDAMGHKLSRNQIKSNYAIVNAAWAGARNKKAKNGSDAQSKDFVEEINLLKMRMAWLPQALKANKSMLPGYGLGHIYEAHTAIQKEKQDPATSAVISGTLSDMDAFKDKFKGLDKGLQEQVYAQGSSQTKQKLEPLMAQ